MEEQQERSDQRFRSLASIANIIARETAKLDNPEDWEPCSGCGHHYLVGKLNGQVCPDCVREQDEEDRKRIMVTQACGGERAYRLFTRETFKATDGNKAAREAVKSFNCDTDNLLLWGPCGTGKTHLASIIGREHASYSGRVIFTEPGPLLRSLRMLTPTEEQAAMDRFIRVPVLILDDLGIEKDTEFAIATISEIISHRLKADRNGLVVTSNLSLDALAAKLHDDRLTSRLAGMCQVVEIKGADMRLQGNA